MNKISHSLETRFIQYFIFFMNNQIITIFTDIETKNIGPSWRTMNHLYVVNYTSQHQNPPEPSRTLQNRLKSFPALMMVAVCFVETLFLYLHQNHVLFIFYCEEIPPTGTKRLSLVVKFRIFYIDFGWSGIWFTCFVSSV